MTSIATRYRKQLEKTFLDDGRQIVGLLEAHGTRSARYEAVPNSYERTAVLASGIRVSEYDYLTMPDVYLRQILTDYWDVFEMAVNEIDKPGTVFMARTLYEVSFRNLLQYVHSNTEGKRIIATKSWLCTAGTLARRTSDPQFRDLRYEADYNAWLSRLNGHGSHQAFLDIKNNGFSTADLGYRMTQVFSKKIKDCIERYSDEIIRPDGQQLNIDVLSNVYNFLSGHVHGQPAHISMLKGDYGRLGVIGRMRTFLIFTAYEVLYLSNKQLPDANRLTLDKQRAFYRRISPHIVRRLGTTS